MSSGDDPAVYAASGRRFAASVVGVVALIVDAEERFLMFSRDRPPSRDGAGVWEAISGGLEARESLIDAVLREVREEAGSELRVEPLGVVHAYTVPFDAVVTHLTSICFLLRCEGGAIIPGDDMAGSDVGWLSAAELSGARIGVPRGVPWIFERAVELHRLWAGNPPDLQPPLSFPDGSGPR